MWKVFVLMVCVVSFTTVCPGMEAICSLVCGDLNQDAFVDFMDWGTAMGFYGESYNGDDNLGCTDIFTQDGYMDANDSLLWDFVLNLGPNLGSFCGWLVYDPSISSGPFGGGGATFSSSGGTGYGSSLLIGGKQTVSNVFSMNDRLYVFSGQGSYVSSPFSPIYTRANGRVTCGYDGKVYQLNTGVGLTRLNDGVAVVTKGGLSIDSDPRYSGSAVVYLGMQSSGTGGDTIYSGRPIMDAAIDAQGYVYVVPVVVAPTASPSLAYVAAAKLQPLPGQTPCYSVVKVYDDPPGLNDNQDPTRKGLREIEVDSQGNVYVISACLANSSNFLWAYPADNSSPVKVALDTLSGVTGGIPDPIALCASRKSNVIYLASGHNSPSATSTHIYALSTQNLSLTLSRTVQINGMGHVTGITENPATGAVYVTGFKMENIPNYFDDTVAPFYHPYLAQVPATGNDPVDASLVNSTDLALPVSITWMPANLISSNPPNEHSLWRNLKNTFRLTFDGDITAPEAGNVLIQEMQDNGQFGASVSSGFTFTVENDGNNHPRILKIRDTGNSLTNRRWYAVRNTGSWKGVANFEVQYQYQKGDSNDDGQVTSADYYYVWTAVATLNCADDDRKDINGDKMIVSTDGSIIVSNNPSAAVPKPSGH
jgi:hypothetical protein